MRRTTLPDKLEAARIRGNPAWGVYGAFQLHGPCGEALMIVADEQTLLVLTGNGDVLEPEGGITAIGSGGNYALAAARALVDYEQDAEAICRKAMAIAAEVCVYTNDRTTVEVMDSAT